MGRWRFINRKYFLLLFWVMYTFSNAQFKRDWQVSEKNFDPELSNNLYFNFEGHSFLQNDEFFGEFIEGYTLMGYHLKPTLMYYVRSDLRLKTGINILKFEGMGKFHNIAPLMQAYLRVFPNLDLILGNLKGGVSHRLIEPIYNPEKQFNGIEETGIQFIYTNSNFWLDTWIDWNQFISKGDTIPEKFNGGVSSELFFLKRDKSIHLSAPFQFLLSHVGGQISNFKEAQSSLINYMSGLNLEKQTSHKFFNSYKLGLYYFQYLNLGDAQIYDFATGKAFYSTFSVRYPYGEFFNGFWWGNNYMSNMGSSLFHSVSDYKDNYYRTNRNLWNSKVSYIKTFTNYIKLGLTVETYFDLDDLNFDYSYGVHLTYSPSFFITKTKVE